MKKIMVTLALVIASVTTAYANLDSVGVFYKSDKVAVLINERGESGRLHDFMDFLGSGTYFETLSFDESVKIVCGRRFDAASCTFTFYPGKDVLIRDRSVIVNTTIEELGLKLEGEFEMSFAGSMKDKFYIHIHNGHVTVIASKK